MRSWNPRRGLEFCLGIFCLLMLAPPHSAAAASPAFQFVIGQDVEAFEDYAETFGHVPDGFMAYTSLKDLEGLWSEADHGGGRQHAERLMLQYPQCFMQLGLYLVDILPDIPKGAYDQNLIRLATWFKVIRVPVYLRVGYEFDGPHNRYDPEEYVAAYRYIVDFLRKKEGVTNVAYVWHSYAGYVDGGPMRWYPGDEYVDWIGVSFFDAYAAGFRDHIVAIAKDLDKPLMVAESALYRTESKHARMLWETWYERYFGFIKKDKVAMVCYINWDWDKYPMFKGQGWFNSRIQDDPYIKEKWVEELRNNGYIQGDSHPHN